MDELTEVLIKIFTGIIIAAVTSYITVHLSRKKFRSERWWEKKVEAYERVIEAFHKSKKFATEHMDAEYKGSNVPEERDEELARQSKEAREEILRASDVGAFILSDTALSILAKYEAESGELHKCKSWSEYLDSDWSITHQYMNEFISEAKRDIAK